MLSPPRLAGALCLLLPCLLAACASSYSPPAPVVPLLDEQGDLSVGANVRPFLPTRGANAYIAAAPTAATRVFVSGSLARYDGRRTDDESERSMLEQNHTTQIEAGAGWGTVRKHFVVELLAGAGYGRSRTNACRRNHSFSGNYGVGCSLWVDSSSEFVRPFMQANFGGRGRLGAGGGGLRVSAVRYAFDMLFDQPSERTATAVTIEPFVAGSVGLPWGKLELSLLLPFVASSPDVTYKRTYGDGYSTPEEHTFRARLIETASPRFTLGIRADLDELWRDRKAGRQNARR
jgi:hypothetical protein